MLVREHDRIDAIYLAAQHLLAKIRAGIDHDRFTVRFDENRAAETVVAGIGGAANCAGAGDHRYAQGSSGAEKLNAQVHLVR
jgi:hypothetical protein